MKIPAFVSRLLLAALLITTSLSAQTTLKSQIDAVLNGPDYKGAHWGLLFIDMDSGQTIYELNAHHLFAPASCTKLFSVAAAMEALGGDYQFQTPVVRRGEVDANGTLNGDLILIASGDLTMGGRTQTDGRIAFKDNDHTYANGGTAGELTEPDPLAGLNELAKHIAASGLKRVTGDVLIDDRLFDKAQSTGSGPSQLSSMIINDNVIDLLTYPGESGTPTIVETRPETATVQVDAQVQTVPAGKPTSVRVSWSSAGRLVVRGEIAADHQPLLRVAEVDDAASFARSLFIEALRRAGVGIDASPLATNRADALPLRDECAKLPRVALLTSPPFAENARLMLKVSHNLHASTLPLLVAAKSGKRTLREGLRIQHDLLAKLGVPVDTISFGGGAGGDRADFATPQAAVELLRQMAKRPYFTAYEAALPILGVDGTLATVLSVDSPARGKVRAKTGTLTWFNAMNGRSLLLSKAMSGYLTTAKGKRLAFAMFVNNTHLNDEGPAREGKVLGKLCEIVYAGGR